MAFVPEELKNVFPLNHDKFYQTVYSIVFFILLRLRF